MKNLIACMFMIVLITSCKKKEPVTCFYDRIAPVVKYTKQGCNKTKDYNASDYKHPQVGYSYKEITAESCEACPDEL